MTLISKSFFLGPLFLSFKDVLHSKHVSFSKEFSFTFHSFPSPLMLTCLSWTGMSFLSLGPPHPLVLQLKSHSPGEALLSVLLSAGVVPAPSTVSLCTQCTPLSSSYIFCGKVWLAHLSSPLGCKYYEKDY